MKEDNKNSVPRLNETKKQEEENHSPLDNTPKPTPKKNASPRQRRIGSYFRMALRNTNQED